MTKHLTLLLFIGLAFDVNSDLIAQRKSNIRKKKLTHEERVEAAKKEKLQREEKNLLEREQELKAKLKKECESNSNYTIGFMPFQDDKYGITEETVTPFKELCYNVEVFEVLSWFVERELENSVNEYHIKKAEKELGLDRLIYGYTYEVKKEDTYQNQLEWTNLSSVLDTEVEWIDNLVKYFEIQTEKRNQMISAEASGNYIYCTAFYLDPKTSEKIFIYQNAPVKKIN